MTEHGQNWYDARCGHITASRVSEVLTKARSKSGLSTAAESYMLELIGEHLTGTPNATFTNWAMQWGHDNEPVARAAYEDRTGNAVVLAESVRPETEGVVHCEHKWIAATPDGYVDHDGLIEIKCPATGKEFARFLWSGEIPKEHVAQMQHQMWVCGKRWCDYVVFHPLVVPELRLVVVRVEADYGELSNVVLKFRDQMVERLKTIIERTSK